MTRISELDLVLPALCAMLAKGGGIQTSSLIQVLTNTLNPTGEDMEILAGRSDTKFSQKVRNLKAHKTLENRGLASHVNGGYEITDKGRDLVENNKLQLAPLSHFKFDDVAGEYSLLAEGRPVEVIDERIVAEGELRQRSAEYRTRSTTLRTAAIEHYSQNGRILCDACNFEFALAYPKLGNGYIQIHHLKPVSYFRGEELQIAKALANVRPLCANCHQMVHQRRPPYEVERLKSELKVAYRYA